jgi:hypothetical protein
MQSDGIFQGVLTLNCSQAAALALCDDPRCMELAMMHKPSLVSVDFLEFISYILNNGIAFRTYSFTEIESENVSYNLKIFSAYLELHKKMKSLKVASAVKSMICWMEPKSTEFYWASCYFMYFKDVLGNIEDSRWYSELKKQCVPMYNKILRLWHFINSNPNRNASPEYMSNCEDDDVDDNLFILYNWEEIMSTDNASSDRNIDSTYTTYTDHNLNPHFNSLYNSNIHDEMLVSENSADVSQFFNQRDMDQVFEALWDDE